MSRRHDGSTDRKMAKEKELLHVEVVSVPAADGQARLLRALNAVLAASSRGQSQEEDKEEPGADDAGPEQNPQLPKESSL